MSWIRWVGLACCGAGLAFVLLGSYLEVRYYFAPASVAVLELLAVVSAVGSLVALLAGWQLGKRQKLLIDELTERIASLRDNPTPFALHPLANGPEKRLLQPVLCQLELLAGCYRQALAEVIRAEEAVDRLQSLRGSAEAQTKNTPASPPPPRYLVGSSRHRMVARLTPNLRWLAATVPLQDFLGITGKDLVGRPFLPLVHPEDAQGVSRDLLDAIKDGENHNIKFRLITRHPQATDPAFREQIQKGLNAAPFLPGGDQQRRGPQKPAAGGDSRSPAFRVYYVQMDVMTYYSEASVPLHLRCHFLDVTKQVLTELELRRRTEELSGANAALRNAYRDLQRLKESYRDLYHNAPVLYFSLDPRGRFVACNETTLRTLGYQRGDLIGQPFTRLLPPAEREAYLTRANMFHVPGEEEMRWLKKDGTIIDVWIGTTTILDDDGTFVRSRSAARDVTERRLLIDALREKNQELAQANIQLRRINQELEEFTYVVSHDLKEPLRTQEAFSNFLAVDYGPVLEGDGQEYISHLVQSTRRLGALIDDLLRLSRAGRVIDTTRTFSWDDLIGEVFSDLRDLIRRRHANVRVEGWLPPVQGDPERIKQLLSNLVANGLKYNQNDRPEVIIGALSNKTPGHASCPSELPENAELACDGQPAEWVTLFVRDNGVGIEPSYHDQIFQVFRRLHRRDEIEGTGAGLAICRKIVHAHGGTLWVESERGQGSTFYFTLPFPSPESRVQSPEPERSTVRGPAPHPAACTPSRSGLWTLD